MDTQDTRIRRLKQLIGDRSVADFARDHELDASYMSQLLNKHRGFGEKAARKIEGLVGVELGWLDLPSEDRPAPKASASQDTGDYAYVDRVQGPKLSAGNGHVVWDFEEIDKSHAFRKDWMVARGLKPERCKLLEVKGESMAPTICDGDLVMINLADRSVTSGEVYALIADDGLRVKRLQKRSDGLIWMISDNPLPRFVAEPITSDSVAIIGRVVWRGGGV